MSVDWNPSFQGTDLLDENAPPFIATSGWVPYSFTPLLSPITVNLGSSVSGPSVNATATAPRQKPGVIKSILSCTAQHYGLGAAAAVVGALGAPVPKSLLGVGTGLAGSTETTSVAGAVGFKLFGAAEPRLGVRLLGTTRIFGLIGRAAPFVSAALFAYDAISIGYCAYQAQ